MPGSKKWLLQIMVSKKVCVNGKAETAICLLPNNGCQVCLCKCMAEQGLRYAWFQIMLAKSFA